MMKLGGRLVLAALLSADCAYGKLPDLPPRMNGAFQSLKEAMTEAVGKVKSDSKESSEARMLAAAADMEDSDYYYSSDEGENRGGALTSLSRGIFRVAILGAAGVTTAALRPVVSPHLPAISRWARASIDRVTDRIARSLRPPEVNEDDEGPLGDDVIFPDDVALMVSAEPKASSNNESKMATSPPPPEAAKSTPPTPSQEAPKSTTPPPSPTAPGGARSTPPPPSPRAPKSTPSPSPGATKPQAATGPADFFGSTLLRVTANGTRLESVDTATALAGRTVALYVSSLDIEMELKASNMTRNLLSTHLEVVRARTAASQKTPLEMVYISLDDDPKSFRRVVRSLREPNQDGDSNTPGQPGWLAVPHCEETVRQKVIEKFVTGGEVPAVVIITVEPQTNVTTASNEPIELVNANALSAMLSNPDAFPWPAKSLKQLLGLNGTEGGADQSIPLIGGGGSMETIPRASAAVAGKKYVGLYFSASWCGPCKEFTPVLCETYAEILGKDADAMEILFVSHDRNSTDFKEYRAKMPWPAVAFEGTGRGELQRQLGVRSLPTFVVLEADTGAVVTMQGRSSVMMDPMGSDFPWLPKPVSNLDTAESLSALPIGAAPDEEDGDGLALVLFTDKVARATPDKKASKSATEAFTEVAKDWREDPQKDSMQFFAVAKRDSDAAATLRSLCGYEDEADESGDALFGDLAEDSAEPPMVVLFDFGNQRFFTSEAAANSPGALSMFIEDSRSGKNGDGTSFALDVAEAPE